MPAIRLLLLPLLVAAAPVGGVLAQEKTPLPADRVGTISTAALTGLASGVIGSLVAPWVHWSIELRRNRLDYRRGVIRHAREDAKEGFSSEKFLKTFTFSILEKDFLPEVISRLKEPGPPPDTSYTSWQEALRLAVVSEIARIERKWGLV